jgi:hypothetical protein
MDKVHKPITTQNLYSYFIMHLLPATRPGLYIYRQYINYLIKKLANIIAKKSLSVTRDSSLFTFFQKYIKIKLHNIMPVLSHTQKSVN